LIIRITGLSYFAHQFVAVRVCIHVRVSEHGNETSGPVKGGEFFDCVNMESVSYLVTFCSSPSSLQFWISFLI